MPDPKKKMMKKTMSPMIPQSGRDIPLPETGKNALKKTKLPKGMATPEQIKLGYNAAGGYGQATNKLQKQKRELDYIKMKSKALNPAREHVWGQAEKAQNYLYRDKKPGADGKKMSPYSVGTNSWLRGRR